MIIDDIVAENIAEDIAEHLPDATDMYESENAKQFEYVFNSTQFKEDLPHEFTYDFQTKTKSYIMFERLRSFSESWTREILSLKLNQKESNQIFQLVGNLIEEIYTVNVDVLSDPNNEMSPRLIASMTKDLVRSELSLYDTAYKYQKKISASSLYVHPEEKAIGTRYEMEMNKQRGIAIPRLIQSKMQFVPITESLKAIFEKDDFLQIYLKYNDEKHVCVEGEYKEFCCGTVFKKNELFVTDPYAIQIQIYTDDFEPCNPLQSKAGVHKLTAVYFSIKNIPQKFRSKLNNIQLVCLCHSDDINKSTQADFNNIWEFVVADLKRLETEGILVASMTLKGSICWPSFDNLGGNVSLGYAGGFSAEYYCRFCECNSTECGKLTQEVKTKIRTRENYASRLKTIESLDKIEYAKTIGVKRHCFLNELNFFHITENISVDILHDLYEGAMPLLIGNIIEHMISCKIAKKTDIIQMVANFDYGGKNKRNTPSILALSKHNLGQNGSQSRCLYIHFPIILNKFKNERNLCEIWKSWQALAHISQIVHSTEIYSKNLQELEDCVSSFLNSVKTNFKIKLTPKLHNLTHYARVIKSMGPVIHQNTIRYEGKHKTFKDMISRIQNFQNPCKVLAIRHQQHISISDFGIKDIVSCGTKHPLTINDCNEDENLIAILNSYDAKIHVTKYLCFNEFKYKKGVFIMSDDLFEIKNVLIIKDEFHFYCDEYEIKEFDSFFHAYKIVLRQPIKTKLVPLQSLEVKKPLEMKIVAGERFLLAETLDIRKCL